MKKTLFLAAALLFLLTACSKANNPPPLVTGTETSSPIEVTYPESETDEPIETVPPVTEPVTSPPETAPKETKVPETKVSETSVPETKAPETQPPKPETEPPAPETEPIDPDNCTITISFTGDCTLGRNQKQSYSGSLNEYFDNKGAKYFLKKVRSIFEADDLTVVNLEGSLTTSTDIQDKLWNHKGPPAMVKILTTSSVEVCTMGNNHRLDYGESGCAETVKTLNDAGLAWCYDQYTCVCEVKGNKIGFVSVNPHYDGSKVEKWLTDGYAALRKEGCIIVIACLHEAYEKVPDLHPYQVELSRKCVDWGFDLVVDNHAHVLQAVECYRGIYIAYSLGNFCYGGNKNPADKDSGILQKTFTIKDGKLVVDDALRFIPCSLSSVSGYNDYRPTPSTGSEKQRILAKMSGYSEQFGIAFDEDGWVIRSEKPDADEETGTSDETESPEETKEPGETSPAIETGIPSETDEPTETEPTPAV